MSFSSITKLTGESLAFGVGYAISSLDVGLVDAGSLDTTPTTLEPTTHIPTLLESTSPDLETILELGTLDLVLSLGPIEGIGRTSTLVLATKFMQISCE
ncbi:hypothetical protein VNO77_18929 [Canavalia gladiata]|uniref:Uncharacterized protein n=1 Tax=Canavalia gladiata TaxID=3824 RepID=A0AAN9LQE9_CANGL